MGTTQQQTVDWRRLLPARPTEYVALVYALVLVWGLGDVLSTYFAYAAVGTASAESNPWIEFLLTAHPLALLAVKAAVVLYAGVVLLACRDIVKSVPGWRFWLSAVVVGGVFVVVNNLLVGLAALA
jgi:hypothetical protein